MNTNNVLGGAIVGGIIVYLLMRKKCKKCGEKIQGEPTTTFVYPPILYPTVPPTISTNTTTSTTTLAPTGGGTVLPKNFVGFTGLKGIM
jgi:hypothetical protein